MGVEWGQYVVYVDESGDHNLAPTATNYPVFVLAFCIFEKETYVNDVVSEFVRFKFANFGHDMVVFHEREIRKSHGPFAFLQNGSRRDTFLHDLTALIARVPFSLVAAVIRKDQLPTDVIVGGNPYHVALRRGLDRVCEYLDSKSDFNATTHIVFEQRGDREDNALELEFRRYCDGDNSRNTLLRLIPVFASKQCNSSGLQLADLVARPIGRHVLQPDQPNRAFDVLRTKILGDPAAGTDSLGEPGLIICS